MVVKVTSKNTQNQLLYKDFSGFTTSNTQMYYKKIDELDGKYIGILNTTEKEYNQAVKNLDNKIKYEKDKYEDMELDDSLELFSKI